MLEITEHVRVDDYEPAPRRDSGACAGPGVRLAVDDAGAGFASLHHILQLCPDIIKLDIVLTRDIDRDPIKRALASSLVSFSRDVGGTLIAEGIETAGGAPDARRPRRAAGARGTTSATRARSPRRSVELGDREVDRDVVAGGVRVGAHLVGLLGQRHRRLVVSPRDVDLELDVELEAARRRLRRCRPRP